MPSKWKIASFNVNSIRARMPILLDWLEKERPDVLCLQETKVQDQEFPEEPIREAGYQVAFRGQKAYNGVSIMSLTPPSEVAYGLGTNKDPDETRLIRCVVDGVAVLNAYVPQGRDAQSEHFQYKLKWFDRLQRCIKKNYSADDQVILVGDLNVAPTDVDVHDPKRLAGHPDFHPEVTKKFEKLISWGFEDVFRKHRPDPGEYSFFDYRVKNSLDRGIGWRIDHLLATTPLAAKSTRAWVDPEPRKMTRPSDHTPICAEFEL